MDKKIVFVHIPKAAGASIVRWGKQNNIKNFVNAGHHSLEQFSKIHPTTEIDKSFAITRNTYHRMLSLYNFAKNKHIKVMKKVELGKRTLSQEHINWLKKSIKVWDKGIIDYLDFTLEQTLINHDQLNYIKDVDLIIPYESLNTDFEKIQKLINCNEPLTQTVHKYKKKAVVDMSTDYIKCIQKHFAEEIDFFQYTP